jgi:hypothetical protein
MSPPPSRYAARSGPFAAWRKVRRAVARAAVEVPAPRAPRPLSPRGVGADLDRVRTPGSPADHHVCLDLRPGTGHARGHIRVSAVGSSILSTLHLAGRWSGGRAAALARPARLGHHCARLSGSVTTALASSARSPLRSPLRLKCLSNHRLPLIAHRRSVPCAGKRRASALRAVRKRSTIHYPTWASAA